MTRPSAPALGIDIGGTSVKVALLVEGVRVASRKSEAYFRPTRPQLIEAIRQACREVSREVECVGVCVPGAWNDTTRVIEFSANVPGVVGVPLDDLVRESIGVAAPVSLFTDAHAAAFDAWANERLPGRFLGVSIGTGVGAAVLDDGTLLQVSGRSSGHMGQWDVTLESDPKDAPLAPDGSRGTLEAYLGAHALRRRFAVETNDLAPRLTEDQPPIRALVRALRIAHALYRPDHVRLLGGLGTRLGVVVPHIGRLVRDHLTSLARPGWTLAVGIDDFHAARGAACLAVRVSYPSRP